MWADGRKERLFSKLTDAEKKLVESFCNDMQCESWERDSRLFSQIWFNAPVIKLAKSLTHGGGKSYAYYFTPEASLPIMKCGHSIEIAGIFNHTDITADTGRVFDETFSKTMRKMCVQFVKTGNPSLSAEISPDGKEKVWETYDLQNKPIMVLDKFNIHMENESALKIADRDKTYLLSKYYCL
ncbi:MAG: carboxylesterase family protein [Selenomonadaceae bacterium]|nr:carboxylesterase family protein [Selenomonadaceae bacterium]